MNKKISNISGLTSKQEKFAQGVISGKNASEEYAVTSAISIRQMIIDRLQKEALDMKNNESARIRALEMLGKVSEIALFTERVETVNQNKTSEEIRAELEDKIQQMFGS